MSQPSEHDHFLELSVRDHGIGISRANMAKLFQAFCCQIDSSLARKFEGTGLGLVMIKQLAELQGGSVAVASAEGEGSCFVVWLPLRTNAEVAVLGRPCERSSMYVERRGALVVDADDQSADLIQLLLEAEGFVVQRAATTAAALLSAHYD